MLSTNRMKEIPLVITKGLANRGSLLISQVIASYDRFSGNCNSAGDSSVINSGALFRGLLTRGLIR